MRSFVNKRRGAAYGYLSLLTNRLLSKFHLFIKIAFFGICGAKFFEHVFTHARKIWRHISTKNINFSKQSEFRKKSNEPIP